MHNRDFLENLVELVRQQLPIELKDFQISGPTMNLVKFHYGSPKTHYEVWIQKRKREAEVGLHFEGEPEENHDKLLMLSKKWDFISGALGREVAGESWGKGWTRIHETVILEQLNDDLLVELSLKLSGMIRTLEPLLRDPERL
jgi:hypothetical protein